MNSWANVLGDDPLFTEIKNRMHFLHWKTYHLKHPPPSCLLTVILAWPWLRPSTQTCFFQDFNQRSNHTYINVDLIHLFTFLRGCSALKKWGKFQELLESRRVRVGLWRIPGVHWGERRGTASCIRRWGKQEVPSPGNTPKPPLDPLLTIGTCDTGQLGVSNQLYFYVSYVYPSLN